MAVSKWFDYSAYMSNKVAQLRVADPAGNWDLAKTQAAFTAAGFVGEEGAEQHFVQYGAAEDVAPNAFFNATEYYRAKAAEFYGKTDPKTVTDAQASAMASAIKNAGLTAWSHYEKYGTLEEVNPSNSFDTHAYMEAKLAALNGIEGGKQWSMPELKAAFANAGLSALEHFMTYGGVGVGEVGVKYTGTIPTEFAVPDAKKVNPSVVTGDTVTLTMGNDVLTGNVFNAPVINADGIANATTLNPADVLTGVGTNPTLNAVLNAQVALAPTLKGIETLNLTTVDNSTFRAENATGIKHLTHNADVVADLTVRNLGTNAVITVNNAAAGADTDVRFVDSVVAGTEDKATLILNNNGSNQTASGVINLRAEANGGFETIAVTANGANHIGGIGSDASVTGNTAISSKNSLRTLTIDGEGSLNIKGELSKVTTVDASANKGGVTLTLDETAAVDVKGGEGNDRFNFTTGLANTDKVDGGSGDNTLIVSNAAGLGAGNNIKAIQNLEFNNATAHVSVDMANLTSVESILVTLANGTTNYSVKNMAKDYAAADGITVATAVKAHVTNPVVLGDLAVDIKGADAQSSNKDVLNVTLGKLDADLGDNETNNFTFANVTANNIETINLHLVDGSQAFTGTFTADALETLKIDGGVTGENFVFGTHVVTGTAISKSAVTKHVEAAVIDGSAALSNLGLMGSTGVVDQTITGGAGDDYIIVGGGATGNAAGGGKDVIDLSAGGKDTVLFSTTAASDDMYRDSGHVTAVFGTVATAAAGVNVAKAVLAKIDKVTGLDFGGDSVATSNDHIEIQGTTLGTRGVALINSLNPVTITGVNNLGDAIDSLFGTINEFNGTTTATGTGASVADITYGIFKYGDTTFLAGSLRGNAVAGFDQADGDFVVDITGCTGTFDASDISFA